MMLTETEFFSLHRDDPQACWEYCRWLLTRNIELEARVKILEGQAKKDSSNSHLPPSSDKRNPGARANVEKSKNNNQREKTGRKPGGQPGHKGHAKATAPTPDRTHEIRPKSCGCGHRFTSADKICATEKRQVHDIPHPVLEVDEYLARTLECPCCRRQSKGEFPPGVGAPVQYGPNLRALAVNLHVLNFIPYGRLADFFSEWCSVRMSVGTLKNIIADVAKNAAGSLEKIRDAIVSSEVIHYDETGSRCGGKREWLHVASTLNWTLYRHHEKRGADAMKAMNILPRFSGMAVHDHWSPYYTFNRCDHAQCGAHLLRDAQGIHDVFSWKWPLDMKQLLKDAHRLVKEAKINGRHSLAAEDRDGIFDRYLRVVENGRKEMPAPPQRKPGCGKRGRPARGKAIALLDRFEENWFQILRFVDDFRVPFDNNLAERDIRMGKVQQKVSGCFRSKAGADGFYALRSVISSAAKQAIAQMSIIRDLVLGRQPTFAT